MKQALITGGVRGIGLATARLLSQKGYAVAVCYSRDEEGAERARKEGFRVLKADVAREEEVKSMFSELGRTDVLVNNAGVSLIKMIQDTSLAEWERVFSVNVTGAFLCSKYALTSGGMLKRESGVILNVSSMWGQTGASCEAAYSASKAALVGFTKALAKEVGYSGIRVNCVAPGLIDTKMNDCFTKEEMTALYEEIPAGRSGRPEEVAAAVYSLIENEYVNGQILGVNGGMVC